MSDNVGEAYVLRQVRETGVKFIGLWFTDVVGQLKSVAITDEQLEQALDEGIAFDGASLAGFTRSEETDIVLLPDPNTFAVLPWRGPGHELGGPRVARMFCDLSNSDGTTCDADARTVLKRTLGRAKSLGYTFYVGCELEWYYFKSRELPPETVDQVGYFDVTPTSECLILLRETMMALEQLGIAVESSHHEVGPGQYELRLQYSDALSMADAIITTKLTVRRLAEQAGFGACFMPKPLAGENGSGLHLSLSLQEGGDNAFFDADDPAHLSPLARHFVGGLLAHAPSLTLVTNQWVNSYKRLIPGYEAPTWVTWAVTGFSDLVRVPKDNAGAKGGAYVEYRSPDPACNPYLAFAALLAAGLDGIESSTVPPPLRTPDQRHQDVAGLLPATLHEAIELAATSELLPAVLGPALTRTLIDNARLEWRRYHAHVSDWELERYFKRL